MSAPVIWENPDPEIERLIKRLEHLTLEEQRLKKSYEFAVDRKIEVLLKLKSLGIGNGQDLRSYVRLTRKESARG